MSIQVDIHRKLDDFKLDISFESSSRRIGILGESGCGKSMTLKSIAGVESIDSGRIVIDDKVVYDSACRINVAPGKRRVGYLFQNYALFPSMTVRGNIEAGVRGLKSGKAERVNEMIEKFGLEGLDNRYPSELSGGQQQRVALARLMAYKPDVILLDEPFSALDVQLKDRMQHELIKMLADYKGTVILVSHSKDEIYRFSDELFIIEKGRSICGGRTKAVFDDPEYVEAARLTGCRNIAAAKVTGVKSTGTGTSGAKSTCEMSVYVPDWDVELKLGEKLSGPAQEGEGRKFRQDISAVGIRAHDFVPVWGEKKDNCIAADISDIAHLPFEDLYYVRTAAGKDDIVWALQREMRSVIREKGLPQYLMIPKENVLLLK